MTLIYLISARLKREKGCCLPIRFCNSPSLQPDKSFPVAQYSFPFAFVSQSCFTQEASSRPGFRFLNSCRHRHFCSMPTFFWNQHRATDFSTTTFKHFCRHGEFSTKTKNHFSPCRLFYPSINRLLFWPDDIISPALGIPNLSRICHVHKNNKNNT